MKVLAGLAVLVAAATAAVLGLPGAPAAVVFAGAQDAAAAAEAPYEVWTIDQSDTTPDGGGTIWIWDGPKLAGAAAASAGAERIDLGGEAQELCRAQTGTAPRRPHMLFLSPGDEVAVIAYVATGHVLFLDADTRTPLGCVDVGVQAHAAVPSPDGTYVLVANQNGKLLQRIRTDYAARSFALEPAATLDLAAGTTPSGAPREGPQRPDNAPICPLVESGGRYAFVTLRGGGLFVVDATATPIGIVAEYDRETVHPNGCGGSQHGGKLYVTSGGGTAANLDEFDVYAFDLAAFGPDAAPPNTPAPRLVVSRDDRSPTDAHGSVLTQGGRHLWVSDRSGNRIVVVDTATDTAVAELPLAGALSGDPSPDLLAVSPSGNRVFAALRGPTPLSGDPHASTGATPGVGVLRVERAGRGGALQAVARITNPRGAAETADPHAIAVRRR